MQDNAMTYHKICQWLP